MKVVISYVLQIMIRLLCWAFCIFFLPYHNWRKNPHFISFFSALTDSFETAFEAVAGLGALAIGVLVGGFFSSRSILSLSRNLFWAHTLGWRSHIQWLPLLLWSLHRWSLRRLIDGFQWLLQSSLWCLVHHFLWKNIRKLSLGKMWKMNESVRSRVRYWVVMGRFRSQKAEKE